MKITDDAKKKMLALFLHHNLDMEIYNLEGDLVKLAFEIINKKAKELNKSYPYDPRVDDLIEFTEQLIRFEIILTEPS